MSTFVWRDFLEVHPAAELFPLMAEAELKELADDILANGLHTGIVLYDGLEGRCLIDGRNRLDALALLGLLCFDDGWPSTTKKWTNKGWVDSGAHSNMIHDVDVYLKDKNPYALALSYNVHRRHLTAEQKRELIAKVLKAKPEASNLAIAKQVKADDKTVAAVRSDLESRSEIPNVATRTDSKGRNQPAKKAKNPKPGPEPEPEPAPTDADNQAFEENLKTAIAGTKREKNERTAVTSVVATSAESTDESAERMKEAHAAADEAAQPDSPPTDEELPRIAKSVNEIVGIFLEESDVDSIATKIFETVGAAKARALGEKLQLLAAPKSARKSKATKPDKPFKKTLELVATSSTTRSRH